VTVADALISSVKVSAVLT